MLNPYPNFDAPQVTAPTSPSNRVPHNDPPQGRPQLVPHNTTGPTSPSNIVPNFGPPQGR